MDLLFIGDPWGTLDHSRDSSLHLASAAEDLGFRCFWTLPENIALLKTSLVARTVGQVVRGQLKTDSSATGARLLSDFHSLHWRVDPPVDMRTVRLWSLLATAGSKSRIVNTPQSLLAWNEKFAPTRFPDWAVPSVISDSLSDWKKFFEAQRKSAPAPRLVAKSADDAASRGVALLPTSWPEAQSILADLREKHGPWIILQEFEELLMTDGETRVFLVHGELAGSLRKRPHPSRPIMSMDAPENERPELAICTLSDAQSERARAVAQTLTADGVALATIDFIGDRILEINVTSPGLIKWMDENAPAGDSIAKKYWRSLLAH